MNNTSILLVDDDDIANFISEKVLRSLGFQNINTAKNGKQAYEYLQGNCPSLVFLDINMPILDGFSFLKQIAEKDLCQKMHVIMLTSSIRSIDRNQASQFNSVISYIEKPLNKEKAQQILDKILKINI
jgi:CheY-like chemotaxis protein